MTVRDPMTMERPAGKRGDQHLRPLVQVELADREEAGERAHHEDVAVGEVDQLDDPVDHRVAEGDESVDEPELQPIQDVLEKYDRVPDQVADEDIGGQNRQDDEEPVAHPGEGVPILARGSDCGRSDVALIGHVRSGLA